MSEIENELECIFHHSCLFLLCIGFGMFVFLHARQIHFILWLIKFSYIISIRHLSFIISVFDKSVYKYHFSNNFFSYFNQTFFPFDEYCFVLWHSLIKIDACQKMMMNSNSINWCKKRVRTQTQYRCVCRAKRIVNKILKETHTHRVFIMDIMVISNKYCC